MRLSDATLARVERLDVCALISCRVPGPNVPETAYIREVGPIGSTWNLDFAVKRICELCLALLNGAVGRHSSDNRPFARAGTGDSASCSVLRAVSRDRPPPLVGQTRTRRVPLSGVWPQNPDLARNANPLQGARTPATRLELVSSLLPHASYARRCRGILGSCGGRFHTVCICDPREDRACLSDRPRESTFVPLSS